jgi:hypothetical protein
MEGLGVMNTQLAIKENCKIMKNAKTPHERDIARMRLNIIRRAKKKNGIYKKSNILYGE